MYIFLCGFLNQIHTNYSYQHRHTDIIINMIIPEGLYYDNSNITGTLFIIHKTNNIRQ